MIIWTRGIMLVLRVKVGRRGNTINQRFLGLRVK